ncbi:nicotinate-nucleotide--dimethylbenzimidazole phosphoribosyltransferase [Treponema sp. OttesenSCG-928-L16]|nr:nicotinate-nucleotide--dimethylbenzimidazole phosphoribosyltransferase [Treponema sp. OttesenSCG-928-L16]
MKTTDEQKVPVTEIEAAMRNSLDSLAKPRGSLGRLEDFCVKMAKIQGTVPPRIRKKGLYIFAGDHGITEEGVSLYPPEITGQMVRAFLSGQAAVNTLAAECGWELAAVDAGVAVSFPPETALSSPHRFLPRKIHRGSRSFLKEDALTREELDQALEQGKELAGDAKERSYDLAALGDMGIGNTSTAAAILSAAGFPSDIMTDRGTGIDGEMLAHKRRVIEKALELRKARKNDALDIMKKLGSCDLAMMTGFILGLRGQGIACVLDGFPVTSAAYMAYMLDPGVTDYLFAGHLSKVSGHKPVLDALGLEPVVSLGMHLGEGSGAVIGGRIVELALLTARNMAGFSQAGLSGSSKEEELY